MLMQLKDIEVFKLPNKNNPDELHNSKLVN